MKTFVITVSKRFPVYHPKSGELTDFAPKINDEIKIHTIRGNYEFWKKRIDKVNAGLAILSIREWTGKPYASKQVELKQLTSAGIQKINTLEVHKFGDYGYSLAIDENINIYGEQDIDGETVKTKRSLFENDGLTELDFYAWFNKPLKNPCIIHFTDFRY